MAATKKLKASGATRKKVATSAKKVRRTSSNPTYSNIESNGIIVFTILSAIFFIIAVIRYL